MKSLFPNLPYATTALEPAISWAALELHYSHHHRRYYDRTVQLTQGTAAEAMTLEQVVRHAAKQNARGPLFQQAAQAWNHEFFWHSMRPGGGRAPHGLIGDFIKRDFGTYDTFAMEFQDAAGAVFGSGWIWVVLDRNALRLVTTGNADTPLVHGAVPVLTLDLWEHAYYLDFRDRRPNYIRAYLTHLVNWEFANQRLRDAGAIAAPRELAPASALNRPLGAGEERPAGSRLA